jgi:hypothetical protein
MKQTIVFIVFFSCLSDVSFAQNLKAFFSPIPKPKTALAPGESYEKMWKWRPTVALPALKLIDSDQGDRKLDAFLLASTGGGLSLQQGEFFTDNDQQKRWRCNFSWSPITVLLSGDLSADNPVNISYATTLGFFNNLLMIGVGYDFGDITGRNSRLFGLLSVGINLNN